MYIQMSSFLLIQLQNIDLNHSGIYGEYFRILLKISINNI